MAAQRARRPAKAKPRIDIVFPVLPPVLDGIGDYTARLACALAPHAHVRILTAQEEATPIQDVEIKEAFSMETRRGTRSLLDAVQADPPDWLLLQFNQFSYGQWGLNLHLPLTVRRIASTVPQTRIAWMAHEDFVPASNLKWAVMTVWQRLQFWMLGRFADLIFFSIEPWARQYAAWFPDTPVHHLPVGSNIPKGDVSRSDAQSQLGIDASTFVAGIFGTLRGSRLMPFIRQAVTAMHDASSDMIVLYVGPDGDQLRDELDGLPVRDAGRLPAEDVSLHLQAMDLHLAPFSDGVSTRRGSFMAGIQHGVPSVSTRGKLTDPMLIDAAADGAFALASTDDPSAFTQHAVALMQDAPRRMRMAEASQQLYENTFSFEVVASKFLDTIHKLDPK